MRSYPTLAEVEQASVDQLVAWNRYLPSPSDASRPVLERIIERLGEARQEDRVAASKAVGWDG